MKYISHIVQNVNRSCGKNSKFIELALPRPGNRIYALISQGNSDNFSHKYGGLSQGIMDKLQQLAGLETRK